MKLKITIKEREHVDLLTKIMLILLGIFATTIIFSVLLNLLDTAGIYLAIFLCILIISLGFRFSSPKTKLRIITWSILSTLLLCSAGYFLILYLIFQNLKDL